MKIGKYRFHYNKWFKTINIDRNNSQFMLIQLKSIKHFIHLSYRNNVGFYKKNQDLPKFLFPKWQIYWDNKELRKKYLTKKENEL
jgi:hypothetical protein